jgi:hypothetical protein
MNKRIELTDEAREAGADACCPNASGENNLHRRHIAESLAPMRRWPVADCPRVACRHRPGAEAAACCRSPFTPRLIFRARTTFVAP